MFANTSRTLGVIRGAFAIMLALVLVFIALPNPANAADKDQELIKAAGKGDLKSVTKLLEDGADVTAKDKGGGCQCKE